MSDVLLNFSNPRNRPQWNPLHCPQPYLRIHNLSGKFGPKIDKPAPILSKDDETTQDQRIKETMKCYLSIKRPIPKRDTIPTIEDMLLLKFNQATTEKDKLLQGKMLASKDTRSFVLDCVQLKIFIWV